MPFLERGWHEHIDKLIDREAFIDSVRVKNAELKDKFLFVVLGLSLFPWCLSLHQGSTTESVAEDMHDFV